MINCSWHLPQCWGSAGSFGTSQNWGTQDCLTEAAGLSPRLPLPSGNTGGLPRPDPIFQKKPEICIFIWNLLIFKCCQLIQIVLRPNMSQDSVIQAKYIYRRGLAREPSICSHWSWTRHYVPQRKREKAKEKDINVFEHLLYGWNLVSPLI